MTVNEPAADLLGVEVGDRLDVDSVSQEQVGRNEFRPGAPLRGPSFQVTVVGIVENPTDVEDGAPSIYFSGALLESYPDIGRVATLIAVRGEPGTTPQSILTAIRTTLPEGVDVYEQESRIVPSATRRAIRLHVVALWVVVVVSALVAILIIAQLAARQVRSATADREPLRALGYDDRQVVTEAAIGSAIIGVGATVVAVVVAIASSGLFPIGTLRVVEPELGVRPDLAVIVVGGASIVIAFAVAGAATALRPSVPKRSLGRVRPGVVELAASV